MRGFLGAGVVGEGVRSVLFLFSVLLGVYSYGSIGGRVGYLASGRVLSVVGRRGPAGGCPIPASVCGHLKTARINNGCCFAGRPCVVRKYRGVRRVKCKIMGL